MLHQGDIRSGLVTVEGRQHKAGAWNDAFTDTISQEIALELRLDSGPSKRLWAYPFDLPTLALGHAMLEMGADGRQVFLEGVCENEYSLVSGPLQPDPQPEAAEPVSLGSEDMLRLMETFISREGLWDGTGCFHRAAVFDPVQDDFPFVAEDIGRHNCIDRLRGWTAANGVNPRGLALFVSARVTASLMAKIARSGYPLVVSRSAVTTASVDMARKTGVTLVGFARPGRFSVFVDPEGRIGP